VFVSAYLAKTLITAGLISVTVLSSFLSSEFCKQHLKELAASTISFVSTVVLFPFVPVQVLKAYLILEKFALKRAFYFHTLCSCKHRPGCDVEEMFCTFFKFYNFFTHEEILSPSFLISFHTSSKQMLAYQELAQPAS